MRDLFWYEWNNSLEESYEHLTTFFEWKRFEENYSIQIRQKAFASIWSIAWKRVNALHRKKPRELEKIIGRFLKNVPGFLIYCYCYCKKHE